jgi:hypothetical protein
MTMRYQTQIGAMKACIEWFDSIDYSGIGRQGLERCVFAFEAEDKDRAISEYRRAIGEAPNFASAMTDLDTDSFSVDRAEQYFNRVMAVMGTMCLIMGGDVK